TSFHPKPLGRGTIPGDSLPTMAQLHCSVPPTSSTSRTRLIPPRKPPMSEISRFGQTILDRLWSQAQSRPDQIVYRFLGDTSGATLTFGQLNQRVQSIAARLREHASLGDRAMLLYPQGLEFIEAFLGCLATGIIAVPAYPPRKNRNAERLWAIIEDA